MDKILIKRNDERGTRTPGMQSITGLAIPRHTGLGYLVTKDFKKRVPLNAFYVFNLFQGKGFYREYYYKKYTYQEV